MAQLPRHSDLEIANKDQRYHIFTVWFVLQKEMFASLKNSGVNSTTFAGVRMERIQDRGKVIPERLKFGLSEQIGVIGFINLGISTNYQTKQLL